MFSVQNIFDLISENLISFTLILVFLTLFQNYLNSYLERRRLPPGPTGLPFVGYLPFLGKAPHRKIAKLGEKYGNVFTVQMGINNVVFLNDYESVKDGYSKDALLGKPHTPQFTILGRPKSLVDDHGKVWQEQRRFSIQLMRDLGFGKGSMEDRITEEISYLTERLDKSNGGSIDIHTFLTPSMSNNVSHLVFGHRLEADDPKRVQFDKVIDEASTLFSPTGMLATCPPWLSNIALQIGAFSQKKILQNHMAVIDQEISNHQKSFDENNKRDYIDGYLSEIQNKKNKDINTSFTIEKLHSSCLAFFGAGSETVRTTTEWCLLIAAHYSEHQKRIQTEIDDVVGNQRIVSWADRTRMPFTQAFICEVFRWKPTIPFNLFRMALEDTNVLNHFIPKDTIILANFWAVHYDPKIWTNPQQFDPARFLSDDGKVLTNTEYIMPFSIGKRNCAGETLARVEVFLYFATLLQRYTISGFNGQKISFEEQFGLSLQPKVHSLLSFKKRF